MKKYILAFLTALSFVSLSCRKTENIESTKPILVKVEAIHTTGQIVSSEIVFIK